MRAGAVKSNSLVYFLSCARSFLFFGEIMNKKALRYAEHYGMDNPFRFSHFTDNKVEYFFRNFKEGYPKLEEWRMDVRLKQILEDIKEEIGYIRKIFQTHLGDAGEEDKEELVVPHIIATEKNSDTGETRFTLRVGDEIETVGFTNLAHADIFEETVSLVCLLLETNNARE